MSQQIAETGNWTATSFWGGTDRGRCVQITGTGRIQNGEFRLDFIQVPVDELPDLLAVVESAIIETSRG